MRKPAGQMYDLCMIPACLLNDFCRIIMHDCNPASDVFALISGFIWKRTQTTQTRLRRSAQSLPPDGGLLPQPLWRCPDRLPSLRFRGFSNPFLKIGVRGGDSGAEPPAVEVSCLLCPYMKTVSANLYPQANACPACFVLIFSIRPFFLRLFVVVKGVPFLSVT